jgi:hypothetical protein
MSQKQTSSRLKVTSLKMPPELLRAAKLHAVANDTTLQSVVTEAGDAPRSVEFERSGGSMDLTTQPPRLGQASKVERAVRV